MSITVILKADGVSLDQQVPVVSVDIQHEVDRIPRARVVIADGDPATGSYPYSSARHFAVGHGCAILVAENNAPGDTLFDGVIVRKTVNLRRGAPVLELDVRGQAWRLTQSRETTVYRDKTDADAARSILSAAGLTAGRLDHAGPKHAELVRYQVSGWDFIVTRAQAYGLLVASSGKTVSISEPNPTAPPKLRVDLTLGQVLDFEMSCDATGQPPDLSAVVWDQKQLVARAPETDRTAAAAGKRAGLAPAELHAPAGVVKQELDDWAKGSLRRRRLSYRRGRLSLPGTPKVEVLDCVDISGGPEDVTGPALVTSVRHRVGQNGWVTDLRLGLDPERLIDSPDVAQRPAGGMIPAITALHWGEIAAFRKDPDGDHRFRVLVTALADKHKVDIWARLAGPYAGKGHGLVLRPEIGDGVVVGFIDGDPRNAVILGSLWSARATPPSLAGPPSETNDVKGLFGVQGSQIAIHDTEKSKITVTTPGGQVLTLDDEKGEISIQDKTGNLITLDKSGLSLTAKGDLTLTANGKVTIKGGGAVTLSGSSIDLD